MNRETIATDLLSLLAPLLASLLIALASLPALEAIPAGLAPRVPRLRRISRISQPQTGLGLATPRRAQLRRQLAEPRSRVRRDETPAAFGAPSLAVRWLKAHPS